MSMDDIKTENGMYIGNYYKKLFELAQEKIEFGIVEDAVVAYLDFRDFLEKYSSILGGEAISECYKLGKKMDKKYDRARLEVILDDSK